MSMNNTLTIIQALEIKIGMHLPQGDSSVEVLEVERIEQVARGRVVGFKVKVTTELGAIVLNPRRQVGVYVK